MGSVILETIVPGLGAIVSLLMYGAPLSAVLRASANKTLGVRGRHIVYLAHGATQHFVHVDLNTTGFECDTICHHCCQYNYLAVLR